MPDHSLTTGSLRLTQLLQAMFSQQAREVASKVSLDDLEVPDLTHWVEATANATKPLLLQSAQVGMLQAQRRIAEKLRQQGRLNIAHAVKPYEDAGGLRRYTPGNDEAFGKVLQSRVVEKGVMWSEDANSGLPLPVRITGVTKAATVKLDFDLFNPRVLDSVAAAAFAFCRETNATATSDLRTAIANLRRLMREGLPRGAAVAWLAVKVREIFADPMRAFRVATTENSRALHDGQLIAAKESGIVTGKTWLASSDACELCLDLDGVTKPLDEPFVVDGVGPYSVIMMPPRHPYCFCSTTEEI